MNKIDMDQIDAAIAALEGQQCATINAEGKAVRRDKTPYKPTRERTEAMRLMDKYIERLVKLSGIWAAVGRNGRAYLGPTSLIAICLAVLGNAHEPTNHLPADSADQLKNGRPSQAAWIPRSQLRRVLANVHTTSPDS
jgi:hypothetical protein